MIIIPLRRNKHTRIDNQRKDNPDQKAHPQNDRSKELHSHNMTTDNVEQY